MSGHHWVDYTGNDKKYGVTLLSFSKYGYDVKQNVLRMSMLRCPTGPDPIADQPNVPDPSPSASSVCPVCHRVMVRVELPPAASTATVVPVDTS